MGTNFYARILPTKSRKEELCKLIMESDDFDNILRNVNNTYESFGLDYDNQTSGGVIHLGKRSGGWKFLWNPNIYIERHGHSIQENGQYKWIKDPDTYYHVYPLTKEGIWNFINRHDVAVYDEYGEQQNKEEFFKEALEWTTWPDRETGELKEAWDGASYQKWEESQGHHPWHPNGSNEYVAALSNAGYKVNWPYTDFYSDGLRFATSNEFS